MTIRQASVIRFFVCVVFVVISYVVGFSNGYTACRDTVLSMLAQNAPRATVPHGPIQPRESPDLPFGEDMPDFFRRDHGFEFPSYHPIQADAGNGPYGI